MGFENEVGRISRGIFDFLKNRSNLEQVGNLKLQGFFNFSGVSVRDDCIQFPECGFHSYKEGNMLFFLGDAPTREPYEFCNAIIDFAVKTCHVEEICIIGGFIAPINHLGPRRVFGTVAQPELRMFLLPDDVSIDVDYQTPPNAPRPSLNHFMLWVAGQREIPAYSLWGEVPFYFASIKDPAGSKSLLEILDKRFALALEFEDIDREIRELNMNIEALKSQNHEINRYLQLLEQGIALSQEEGETLVREVAAFLRRS
ncbi:MAG: PAC2 family protein [Dehalococcoidia bacterium]